MFVKQLSGTNLWDIGDDDLLLIQQGDELSIPPNTTVYSYAVTASLNQCHQVVNYEWIPRLDIDVDPIVKIYLCFMVLGAGDRDVGPFKRFLAGCQEYGSQGLEGYVGECLGLQAAGSSQATDTL